MQGKAIIFSAPSGSGKSTIVNNLLNRIRSLRFSISATTRKKRTNEIDGRDYYFYSVKQFQEKINTNELLEWEEVYPGLFYGTLKNKVEEIWLQGNHVIFDVDVKGGKKLKNFFGSKSLALFVKVVGEEVLRERLEKRNTENQEMLNIRIEKATSEMKEEIFFDKVVMNDDLGETLDRAEQIVQEFINS